MGTLNNRLRTGLSKTLTEGAKALTKNLTASVPSALGVQNVALSKGMKAITENLTASVPSALGIQNAALSEGMKALTENLTASVPSALGIQNVALSEGMKAITENLTAGMPSALGVLDKALGERVTLNDLPNIQFPKFETNTLELTEPVGYEYLENLRNIKTASSQAFVAMWFDPNMDSAWEDGFEPGIRDAGYRPIRIDKEHFNHKIDDEIEARIRQAKFLVADTTSEPEKPSPGVYYEAGIAKGIRTPIIFTCHKSRINNLHFDIRQFNHIIWSTPEDLRAKLARRISKTIGKGPLTPPSP